MRLMADRDGCVHERVMLCVNVMLCGKHYPAYSAIQLIHLLNSKYSRLFLELMKGKLGIINGTC